jgi:hypothetical protein
METSRQDRLTRIPVATGWSACDRRSMSPVRVNLLLLERVTSLNRVCPSRAVAATAAATATAAAAAATATATATATITVEAAAGAAEGAAGQAVAAIAAATAPIEAVAEAARRPREFTAREFTRVNRCAGGRASSRAAAPKREPILPGRLQQLGHVPAASLFLVALVAPTTEPTSPRTP